MGKVIELQKTFVENYTRWEILERVGNLVFLTGVSVTGGKRRWDVTWVKVDENFVEFASTSMNNDGLDPTSSCFNKEKKYQEFLKVKTEVEKNVIEKQNEAEAKKEMLRQNNLWMAKLETARAHQSALITELKLLNRASDDLTFFQDKKVIGILKELSLIEQYCHHSK